MITNRMVLTASVMALGIALVAPDATAGLHGDNINVTISGTSSFTASGSIGVAHRAASTQEIGCSLNAYGGPDAQTGEDLSKYDYDCWAITSTGVTKRCSEHLVPTSEIANFINVIGTINTASFVMFKGTDGGACTEITVDNNSKYLPKKGNATENHELAWGEDPNADHTLYDTVGDLGSIRNSFDSVQLMGCYVGYAGTTRSAQCYAKSPYGVYKYCVTNLPHVINLLSMLTSDAYLDVPAGLPPVNGETPSVCDGRVFMSHSSRFMQSH